MMVSPEAWPGILQEHPAVITTGGVNMCPHGPPILYMTTASELCLPSTRPGTRFTDGSAGGLEYM